MTQQQVAEALGITRERVSQIERGAFKKIRAYLDRHPEKKEAIMSELFPDPSVIDEDLNLIIDEIERQEREDIMIPYDDEAIDLQEESYPLENPRNDEDFKDWDELDDVYGLNL